MASSSQVLLILGAGGRVGTSVARLFASKGYKVAVSSRTDKSISYEGSGKPLFVAADLSDPSSVPRVFEKVKKELGTPSVVVYNAGAATFVSKEDPMAISLDAWTKDFNVNTTSVFAALQEALKGFADLPEATKKTFIFTGNACNESVGVLASAVTAGIGKTASAYLMESATLAYGKSKGWRFYYADQRSPEGKPMYTGLDGDAHAETYWDLADSEAKGKSILTFVKDQGIKAFPKI